MDSLISTFHIDIKLLVAQAVNFAIVFSVLYFFAIKPIAKIMNERSKKIGQGIQNAEKAQAELISAEEKKTEVITDARKKANQIISLAHEDGKKLAKEEAVRAEEEALKIKMKAESDLEAQKIKMEREVAEKTASLIVSGTEKILRENMTEGKNDDFIKEFITRHG